MNRRAVNIATLQRLILVHLAANYPPELVDAVVCRCSTADSWTDAGITRWIHPQHILARPWNPFRLDRARSMLANGIQLRRLLCYRIGRGTAIYECEDGIHRTVAAREAGRKVKARIKGYYQLRPQALVLYKDCVWRPDQSQPGCWWQVAGVSADMLPLLHALGVRERE